jgi:hypothetical protein
METKEVQVWSLISNYEVSDKPLQKLPNVKTQPIKITSRKDW